MKTSTKTGGFGGGYTGAREAFEVPSRQVVPFRQSSPRSYRTKEALSKRQLRQGKSCAAKRQMTDDSLAHLPRWKRWAIYVFAGTCMTGIVPMAAAGLLTWLCEQVGWWLLIPLYIVVLRGIWRVMWS